MRILPLTALLLAVGAAPATAAASPLAGTPAAVVKVDQARFGGGRGFGRSTYRSRPRYTPATRYRARPHLGRHLFRGVLQALGIAYLAHLLFGLGAGGGSPLGLLIVLGLILWMATRRRRRLAYQRW